MTDQQQSTAHFPAEAAQFRHHLPSDGDVQACGGLIGDQQRRVEGDGQGNGQPLTHASAQFMGIGPIAACSDADPLEQCLRTVSPVGGTEIVTMGSQGVHEVIAHCHQWIHPGHGVLKHESGRLTPQVTKAWPVQFPGIFSCE